MKKLIFGALIVLLFIIVAVPVLAEDATSTGNTKPTLREKLQEKIQKIENRADKKVEKTGDRLKKLDEAKVKVVERVRKTVVVRWNVLNKAVGKSENLLEKLQVRIDKAKAAGKDVGEAEVAMADAKGKLADAKEKLDEIKDLKGTAVDREDFQDIQNKFKEVQKDLHAIKVDASKIIRILKGFNSATSSGKNPQATGSSEEE